MSLGLCVPKDCDIDDFAYFIGKFTPILNSLVIPIEFQDILEEHQKNLRNTKYASKDYLNITIDELEFVNSTERNIEATSFGFGSFLVCLIVTILIIIVIVSSILQWRKDKQAHLKRLEAI